mmetsp:Transcript_1084/g.2150  ORF Transcript_1084/g.2150 Transcript_1084/m.2150 type:complete len:364 (+) Transcript_1084:57-1148(+)
MLLRETAPRESLYAAAAMATSGGQEKRCRTKSTAKRAQAVKKTAPQDSSSLSLEILPGRPTIETSKLTKRWQPLAAEVDAAWIEEQLGPLTSVRQAAIRCLEEGNARRTAALTLAAADRFERGLLRVEDDGGEGFAPEEPGRDDIQSVDPKNAPKRGKGGSAGNRLKLVHSLCHIESVAIDLSWDMVARFGYRGPISFPAEFVEDWLAVAQEEAVHYLLWEGRLLEQDSFYGAFPAHSGLWDSAKKTNKCVLDRLVIEHCVLEARGLDVAPISYKKFMDSGDKISAEMLKCIYAEEVSHVAKGMKWFNYAHKQQAEAKSSEGSASSLREAFHAIVADKLTGRIKPPYNEEARSRAGMDPSFYQ